jgi:hypothetical protein
MARAAKDFGALLAAGLRGLGGGMGAASAARDENERRREAFRSRLRSRLRGSFAKAGAALVAATLGRGVGNAPIWLVTLHSPAGLSSTRVRLSPSTEPYSEEALRTVVASVRSTLLSGHAGERRGRVTS